MNRLIEPVLIKRLNTWRSVALLGARQVGKSYALQQMLHTHPGTLFSLDDPNERQEAARDPLRYVEQRYRKGRYLVIDEAARVPEIFSAVKILVDRHDPKPTGICLANSGNYLRLRNIKESLAGRVSLVSMYSLSWQELASSSRRPGLVSLFASGHAPLRIPRPASLTQLNRQREERLLWGGMPAPALQPEPESRILWARDYVRTYILPLVVEQFHIRESLAFEQAARSIMLCSGRFFNANQLASSVGVSQPTLQHYAHILQAMMVVQFVPVFFRNLNKRLVKQPKVYVMDPLLLNQSLDSFSFHRAINTHEIGRLYEVFVFAELQKTIANYGLFAETFTWRTQDQAEVDIVISAPKGLLPFEVTWSQRPTKRDASGLLAFLDDHPDAKHGYIIYPGQTVQRITPHITALPDWWLFGSDAPI
ncbi:MAG: ATP-binding protein [Candidatus Omnitrophica bacterium]|nr:ATP-binding protein [Candidatus Omnitrophota bacterium]